LKKFKNAGITVYSNAGNHDYLDGRETIHDTPFGEMVDLGLINYVGTDTPPKVFNVEGGKVTLFGVDYHVSLEKVKNRIEEIDAFKREENEVKIALTHSNITSDTERLTDFTYGQLSGFDIDILNCGHWHLVPEGGAIQTVNNTTFLNPWNLTRVSREYNVKLDEHKPEMIHVKITFVPSMEPQFEFKEVFLNVGRFSETFNIDVINMLQELGKEHFSFFEEIELNEDVELDEDEKLLVSLAETQKISPESIKIAKELIS
jgi:DNA repair exonuclease SbcCD nuclease subunit